jgi:DNA-binding beta-propeller fold protein YncE
LEQITINTMGFHDGSTFWEQDPPHPAAAVFAISGHVLPATLNPGESYQFQISFTPPVLGAQQPGNPLTLCVTTAFTGQHIHYLIPLTGTGISGIAPTGVVYGLVHVPNRGVVVIFEVPSGRLIGEVDLQALSMEGPWPITITPNGAYGLINVPSRGVVVIFEIATANLLAEVNLGFQMTGPSPIAVTPDGQHGLIYMFNRGTVVVFAIPTGTVEQEVNLGVMATGLPLHTVPLHRFWTGLSPLVLTPDGRYALIHVPNAMVVKIFEVSSGTVTGEVPLQAYATEPAPITVTSDGRHGLIHVPNRGVVTIFEIPSGNVVAEVDLQALLLAPCPVVLIR